MAADEKVVKRLYAALGERDGDAMAALYAPYARFTDPVFTDLKGPEVGAMWRMLCRDAQELRVEVRDVRAASGLGDAVWEAWYAFGPEARMVRNVGHARFVFRDGLIAQHVDDWHFQKWAAQALGWQGKALGWTQPFHDKVRKEARARLERFMASAAGPPGPPAASRSPA